jgi:tetratricopeptide (TPR) repeat protein
MVKRCFVFGCLFTASIFVNLMGMQQPASDADLLAEGERLYEQRMHMDALKIFSKLEKSEDTGIRAKALCRLGNICMIFIGITGNQALAQEAYLFFNEKYPGNGGYYNLAIDFYERAERTGDLWAMAEVWVNLGAIYEKREDFGEKKFEKILIFYKMAANQTVNKIARAWAWYMLGLIYCKIAPNDIHFPRKYFSLAAGQKENLRVRELACEMFTPDFLGASRFYKEKLD